MQNESIKGASRTLRSGMAGRVVGATLLVLGALIWGGAVAAAPPGDESVENGKAKGQVACPYLTQARYPFLACKKDALGNIVFDAPPQQITGLRIPTMDSFIEGPGYWGS